MTCNAHEINRSHSTVIALFVIDHTLWSGVFCRAMHADSLSYKLPFLLSQTELILVKDRLLYCTESYIHHLLTYLAFLLNTMQFIKNAATKKYPEEGLPSSTRIITSLYRHHQRRIAYGKYLPWKQMKP